MTHTITRILKTGTIKDSLITLTGNGLVAISGAVFTIILARTFSPDKFGLFSALWSLAILLASIGDFGISTALTNFLPKLRNERSAIISLTFWIQLIIALILGIIAISIMFLRGFIIPGSLPPHYLLIGILVFIYILEAFIANVFNAERRFIISTTIQAIDSFTKLFLLAFIYYFYTIDIQTALLIAAIAALIATIYGLTKEFKNITFTLPAKHFENIFKFTKWIAVSKIFSVAISRIDIIILTTLSTGYQAGMYSAASRIALIFTLLVSSIGNVTAPRFSSFSSKVDLKKYLKKLLIFSIFLTTIILFSIVISRPLITIIFGEKYIEAIPVFRLLALSMIPFILTLLTINPIIYYFNKPNFIAKIIIIQVGILITLDILFIPSFGAIGPAISLGIANTFVLIMTAFKMKSLLTT